MSIYKSETIYYYGGREMEIKLPYFKYHPEPLKMIKLLYVIVVALIQIYII